MVLSREDYSAIGRRAKRKGKTYERRCGKLLTEFTGFNFRPVPASGGWNKQGVVVREELFCGDVICDNSNFKFCIESKNRNEYDLESTIKNPATSSFTSWWYQCVSDSESVKLFPLLFFKPDNKNDFVAFSEDGWNKIGSPNVPHIVVKSYEQELTFKYRDYKETIMITKKLPIPFITDWKYIKDNCDSKLFF